MSKDQTSRRGVLSGLAASAFAPLAGLLGGRAMAAEPNIKAIGDAATSLKMPKVEYQVVWRSLSGDAMLWGGSFKTLADAIECRDANPYHERAHHPLVGEVRPGEIEWRFVGEWEAIEGPCAVLDLTATAVQ